MKSNTETVSAKTFKVDGYALKCYTETPGKTEKELPAKKLGAFDLFNLFTADIIRSKKEFTR